MRGSIAALVFAVVVSPASAERGQAHFSVAATVPVRVVLEVIDQPTEVTLTAQDIARGYKDVSARYRVRHNDRNGYLLQLAPRSGITQQIEVRGLGATELVLHDDVVGISRPGDEFQQELALQFRFVLAATTLPGTFELPVNVAASPL